MAGQQIVIGSGNTTKLAGVTVFTDNVTVSNTVTGSGQTNISVTLGTAAPSTTYYSGGGSGTVSAAGANDLVILSGTKWLYKESLAGGDTIDSSAGETTISTYGQGHATTNSTVPSNAVYLSGAAATVNSLGTNDLIESYAGKDLVNMYNTGDVLVDGGAVTIGADGSGSVKAFFDGNSGGTLDFINNSTVAASVTGNVPNGHGGSVTAYGGTGGGVFVGGAGGNNSLVGGTGTVDLIGAGSNNFLLAKAYGSSYSTQNILNAGTGGATLEAASTTSYNEFFGGTGTDLISSAGAGAQTYYIGASGVETITGSQASGATNEYIFNQDTTGAGTDLITDFRLGKDHIDINLNGTLSGVTFKAIAAATIGGAVAGTLLTLSDNTTITLYGVNRSSISTSIIGGTHI
jgi:hypothetical protein